MDKSEHVDPLRKATDLLWTDSLQHVRLLDRIQYPTWLRADLEPEGFELTRRNHEVLTQEWNGVVQKLRAGRYSEIRSIFSALQERKEEVAQELPSFPARIRYQQLLLQTCREKKGEYGEGALMAEMLPLDEKDKDRWSATYAAGYEAEDFVNGTYVEDYTWEKRSYLKVGYITGQSDPEQEGYYITGQSDPEREFLKECHLYLHIPGREIKKEGSHSLEMVPRKERTCSFSADTLWEAAIEKVKSRLDKLQNQRAGTQHLVEVISFRCSVLQNVLALHEVFGYVPCWEDVSERQKRALAGEPRFKNNMFKRRMGIVAGILLEQDKEGNFCRSSEWEGRKPQDLFEEVELQEDLNGDPPGNSAEKYFRRKLDRSYPDAGTMEGWFRLAEEWQSFLEED